MTDPGFILYSSTPTNAGSTISTLLHEKINPKDCQVLCVGDSGLLLFFRVVSSDYGKPRNEAEAYYYERCSTKVPLPNVLQVDDWVRSER